jgi:predicted DNA binding CopG/RHH family protein
MATVALTTEKKEVKATWRIPDNILVELKHLAIDDRVPVQALVIQALEDYLSKRKRFKK